MPARHPATTHAPTRPAPPRRVRREVSPAALQCEEQVVLVLTHTPADRRQLVATGHTGEVGVGLHDAHDAPLQRSEHFPPPDNVGVDGIATRRLVCLEQSVVVGNTRGRVRRTGPPPAPSYSANSRS